MTVLENIENGIYNMPLYFEHPSEPKQPSVLRKSFADMNEEERKLDLNEINTAYEKEMQVYKEYMENLENNYNRLEEQFRNDLEEEFGMKGHPKANMLYHKAYEFGRRCGKSEIYYYYSDMYQLIA